jgi:hypothetical protein
LKLQQMQKLAPGIRINEWGIGQPNFGDFNFNSKNAIKLLTDTANSPPPRVSKLKNLRTATVEDLNDYTSLNRVFNQRLKTMEAKGADLKKLGDALVESRCPGGDTAVHMRSENDLDVTEHEFEKAMSIVVRSSNKGEIRSLRITKDLPAATATIV